MRKGSIRTVGIGAGLVLVAALAVGFGVAQAATGGAKAVSPLQKACGFDDESVVVVHAGTAKKDGKLVLLYRMLGEMDGLT